MTIPEFRERLRGLGLKWYIDVPQGMPNNRMIRSDCGCPLDAVFGSTEELSWEDTNAVIDAADDCLNCDPALRQALLEDCGLA